jgi:hypothetical protein
MNPVLWSKTRRYCGETTAYMKTPKSRCISESASQRSKTRRYYGETAIHMKLRRAVVSPNQEDSDPAIHMKTLKSRCISE